MSGSTSEILESENCEFQKASELLAIMRLKKRCRNVNRQFIPKFGRPSEGRSRKISYTSRFGTTM